MPRLGLLPAMAAATAPAAECGNAKSVSAVVTNANKALGKDDFAAAYTILEAGLARSLTMPIFIICWGFPPVRWGVMKTA